ncbi:MAG: carboxypeptidase-like regulatory domain-containing protein, partial [Bacteroidota bacterium]
MSANNLSTNELLDRYLSGAITAPQEAELERRAIDDPVLAEALAGLQSVPEEDHALRIDRMVVGVQAGIDAQSTSSVEPGPQVQGKDQGAKVRPLGRYLAAASVLLLLAVAVFLLPRFGEDASADLAMTETAPAPKAEVREDVELDEAPPLTETETLAEETAPPDPAPSPANDPPQPQTQGANLPVAASTRPAPEPQETPAPPVAASDPTATVTPEVAAEDEVVPPLPVDPLEADNLAAERLAREAADRAAAERRKRAQQPAQFPAPAAGRSAPGSLSGRITDEKGRPITGALVRLPGLPLGERTDTNGVFTLAVDATASRIEISHPDFVEESVDIRNQQDDLQLSLEAKGDDKKDYRDWTDSWAAVKVPISNEPGYALPEEGYPALRKRIEANKPDDVPAGKVKLSFTVNPDGTLEDFVFKGRPSQATMDYVGGTIARTSIWEVKRGDKPVRVYFKVVF